MMKDSDDIIKWIMRGLPINIRICFGTGILSGLLTHMYILTHKLPMWDDMNGFYGNGMTRVLARWMLDYVDWISGYWSVPWINGLITILLISIAACFVYSTLQLRTMTSAILIPIMMVTFPSVSSTMGFTFTTDSYAFGIMMACVAAYLIRKGKYGFVFGIICMCMSLGCYQAYFPLCASILVICYIIDIFEKEKEFKLILLSGIKSIVSLIISLIIYINLANYLYPNMPSNNGVDKMGQLNIGEIPSLMLRAYKEILKYFVFDPMSFVNREMHGANITVTILCVAAVCTLFILLKLYKNIAKTVLLIALCIAFPACMAAIYIMAPDANVSMLMLYAYVMLYVFLIALWESIIRYCGEKRVVKKVYSFMVVLCISLIAHSNFIIDNEAYFRSSIAYERVKDYFSRMMCRVEAMDGYQYGDELAILGEFCVLTEHNTNPLSVGYRIDDEKFIDFSGIALENGMMTLGSRDNFLRIYLGIDLADVELERKEQIQNSEEYAAMPNYPAEGSIKKIDGVWVVKLVQDWETYQDEYLSRKTSVN